MATLGVKIDPTRAQAGARVVKRELADIKREAEKVERGTKRLSRSANDNFRDMARGIDNVSARFNHMRAVVAGVAGFITGAFASTLASLNTFGHFEQGLIGVGKTADISGAALQALGKDIQRVAREVPIATTDLLGIAQAAGQLGVKGTDNIIAFTETVGKLGLASDLAGEEAATSLARILTVTGTAIGDVDRLGSTIVQLGNNFAATESEIARAATRTAQATSQFDAGAANVAGIAATMAALGVEAEAGGTQVGLAFQSINDAIRKGGKELKILQRLTGDTGKALREQFFGGQSAAVFEKFIQGLGRAREAGSDVGAILEEMGLNGVRAIQVLGTMATRSDVLAEALRMANEEWQVNNALNKEAATAAQAFFAQLQLMKNAISEVATELGARAAPGFTMLMNAATKALHTIADNMDTIMKLAKVAGAALLAAFGPAILSTIASGFVAMGRAAVGAISAITTAIAANPIGALAVAFAAIIVAAYQFRDEIEDILGVDVVAAAKGAANRLIGIFVGAYNTIVEAWGNLPTFFTAIGKQAWNNLLSELEKPLLTFGDKVIIPGISVPDGARATLTPEEQAALAGATATFNKSANRDYIGNFFGTAETSSRSATDAINDFNTALKGTNLSLDDLIDAGGKGGGKAGKLKKSYDDIVRSAQQFIAAQRLEQQAIGLTEEAANRLRYEQELLNKAANDNIQLTPQQAQELKGLAGAMAAAEAETKRLKDSFEFAKDTTKQFFSDFFNGLRQGESVWKAFANAAMRALDKIIDKLLDELLDAIFQVNSAAGGGGGLFGFIGGLLGFGGGFQYFPGGWGVPTPGVGLWANGGAFQSGNVIPFAQGGIVTQPTLFPMANGAGLMGEAGPEAIMPLRRLPNGRLGVEAANANHPQAANDTVITVRFVNEDGQEVGRAHTTGGDANVDVALDRIIAQKIGASGSMTSRALEQRFGLRSALAAR